MKISNDSLKNSAEITRAIFNNYYPNDQLVVKNTSFSSEGVYGRTLTSRTVSDALAGDALYRSPKFSLTFYNKMVNSSLNSLITGGSDAVFESPTILTIKNPESLDSDGGEDDDDSTPSTATLTGGVALNRIIAGSIASREGGGDLISTAASIAVADISNAQKDPEYIAAMAHSDEEYPTDVAMITSGSRTIALASKLTEEERTWIIERGELLRSKGVINDGKYLSKGFAFDLPNNLKNLTQTETFFEGMDPGNSVEQELVDAASQTAYICPSMIELLLYLESKTSFKGFLGAEKASSSTGQTISGGTAQSGSSINDHVFGRAFDMTRISARDDSVSVDFKNEGQNVSKYRRGLHHFLTILNSAPRNLLPDLITVHGDLAAELGVVPGNEGMDAAVKKQYPNLKYVNFRADAFHKVNIHFSFSAQRSGQYVGTGGRLGTPGQFLSPAPMAGYPGAGTPPNLNLPKFKDSYANNTSGTLTPAEIYDLLRGTVMSDEAAAVFVAVAVRESGARPAAFNPNAVRGDWSIGMFQVNLLTDAHGLKTYYFPIGKETKPGWQFGYKDWQKDGVNAGNFNSTVERLYSSAPGDHNQKVTTLFPKVDPICWIPFNQVSLIYTCIKGATYRSDLPIAERLGATPETGYVFGPWGDYRNGPKYGFISNVDFKDAIDVYVQSGKNPAYLRQWVIQMFATAGRGSLSAQYGTKWVDGWFYESPYTSAGFTIKPPVQRHQVSELYPNGTSVTTPTPGSGGSGGNPATPTPGGGGTTDTSGTYPVTTVILPSDLVGVNNGQIPENLMTAVSPAQSRNWRMHNKAARAWEALRAAALSAGHNLAFSGNPYRTYAEQEALFIQRYSPSPTGGSSKTWNGKQYWLKPGLAMVAVPGTSNHGLGLAVDTAMGPGQNGYSGVDLTQGAIQWLLANAASYGFSWEAQSEPWHLRYWHGDELPNKVKEFERKQR